MGTKRLAIIIGTSDYEDTKLAHLESPTQDAMGLTNVLQDPRIGAYEVKMFLNASSYSVNKAIEGFCQSLDRDDVILLYLSGHGIKDDDGRLHFAAADTRINLLRSTAISASFINDAMNSCRSRNQIMLLDCCYSGAFAREMRDCRGRVVIASSNAIQFSFEARSEDGLPGTGVFTSTMIQGLKTGDADLDQDGLISVQELYEYIYTQLVEVSAQQIPRMSMFDIQGRIIVAKNCRL